MSWAEVAITQGAIQAGKLPLGPVRESALRGLEVLAEPDVVEVIERRGPDALKSMAAHLIGEDLTGARQTFTSTKSGLAGIGEELRAINAARAEALAEEQQAREDWAVIMTAIGRVGVMAAKLGLTLILAGL